MVPTGGIDDLISPTLVQLTDAGEPAVKCQLYRHWNGLAST